MLQAALKSCEAKLIKFYDNSTTESEYYYFSTGTYLYPTFSACHTPHSTVLDPRFGDRMFKNPKNSDFFSDEWIRGCEESLLDKMEALQAPIPTDSNIPPAPSGYETALDDLIDLDILGEQESSPVRGESPQEELARYLRTARCGIKDDPLLWWKKNIHTYPTLAHIARDMLAIPGGSVLVERTFSGGRDLISLRRASLNAESIEKLMQFRAWILFEFNM